MCGVLAWFKGPEPSQASVSVAHMTQGLNRLQHRGPDGVGLAAFDRKLSTPTILKQLQWNNLNQVTRESPWPESIQGWMGHTLLAIAAPSLDGVQPACDANGDVWLSFNGEIYNHNELRQQLKAEGVVVKGQGDTPVLLHWIKQKGLTGIRDLNGVFAFVAYWPQTKTLWIGRDRLGVKPLYYAPCNRGFGFASEVKALLPLQKNVPQVDTHALTEILTFQNIWTPRTLFEGVSTFPAGHVATIDLNKSVDASTWILERYWKPVFQPNPRTDNSPSRNLADWMAELRHQVMQAAHRQNVSANNRHHVSRASVLSGGLDSSSMVAGLVASDKTRADVSGDESSRISPLQTFTCGFSMDGPTGYQSSDERPMAETIAKHIGTQHAAVEFSSQALWDALEATVWSLEAPIMGPSTQHLLLNQAIASSGNHIKVLYTGTGGDELLGGYPWRYNAIHSLAEEPVVTNDLIADTLFHQWVRVWTDAQKKGLAGPELQSTVTHFDSHQVFRGVWQATLDDNPEVSPLAKAQSFDLKTFLPGLLQVDERLAMAASLEGRVPWLDHDLMDFTLSLPDTLKLGPMQYGQRQSKYVLRQAMASLLPTNVLNAPKKGFVPPLRQALAGPLLPQLTEALIGTQKNASPLTNYLDANALQRLITQHQTGQVNHTRTLWTLVSLSIWLKTFVLNDSAVMKQASFV